MTVASSSYLVGQGGNLQTRLMGDIVGRVTQTGAQAISVTEPEGMDLTREGRRFMLGTKAAITGIAPVQAVQTTACQWGITNPATNTTTAFFDSIGVWQTAGTGAATGYIVLVTIFATPAQTAFTTGLGIMSCNGSTKTSNLVCKDTITITSPAAPVWVPIAIQQSSVANTIVSLAIANYEIRGRIAIPPGFSLGINVSGAAGTSPLYAPIASWVEIESSNS